MYIEEIQTIRERTLTTHHPVLYPLWFISLPSPSSSASSFLPFHRLVLPLSLSLSLPLSLPLSLLLSLSLLVLPFFQCSFGYLVHHPFLEILHLHDCTSKWSLRNMRSMSLVFFLPFSTSCLGRNDRRKWLTHKDTKTQTHTTQTDTTRSKIYR